MSNLLKDASILLTPTAYENGRMNSIKPYKDLYGSDIVTNGGFDTSSNWTIVSGSPTISGGKLNMVSSSDKVRQSLSPFDISKVYKVEFTISNYISGGALIKISNSAVGTTFSSNGTHTFFLSGMANNALDIIGTSVGGVQPNLSIDNVSVVEDLSGDFQFSRGSAATRVNAQGLVENVQIISEELVSNGDFSQIGTEEVLNGNFSQIGSEEVLNGNFSQEGSELITNGSFNTDSNWTLSSGITYNANGYIDFDGTQGGGQARNTPNITFVQGKTYKVVYEIKNYVSGAIKFRFQTGWNTIGQQQSGNGLKTEYIVCNDSSNNNFQFFNSPSFIGSIDNVSVKEVGQNWSFSNDVSVGNGVATFLDGGSNPNTSIKQSNILTSGKTYKLTFNVSRYVNGRIQVFVGSSASTHNIDISNGVGTYTLEATSTGTDLTIKRNGTYPNFDFDITNISVKEVGQNWTLGSDWSIGDNKAVRVGTSAGNLTQSPFTIGKTYKVSWEQSNGFIAVYGNTLSTLLSNTGNEGVHTVYFTPTSSDRLDFRSTDNDAEVTNISVKEVGQDWTLGTGWSIDQANSKAKSIQTGTNNYLQQTISTLSNNKLYRVTFDLDIISSTTTTIGISNTGAFGQLSFSERFFTTSGTKTFDALYSDAYPNYIRFVGGAGTEFTITNISVKEITDDTDIPRINYSGFSYQDSLGSELVVNGDFSVDSNWSKGPNWTISDGKANSDGSSSGQILQSNVFESNKTYQVTFTVTKVSGSGLIARAFYGSYETILSITESGTYTANFTPNASTNGTLYFLSSGLFEGSIDNVSVKEVTGQEVVPDSGCGSWLLEPQSTNLLPYSSDFSQWNATGSTTIESGYLAPDGTLNAYKVSGSGSTLQFDNILNGTNTRTIWARTVSGTGKAHLCSYHGNTDNLFDITDKWQRFEVNVAIATGAGNFYAVDFRGSTNLSEVILWGAQAEQQSYSTSYIPTNGAASTRLQDIATNSGNATLINSTEGVLYAEMAALAENEGNRCITISANSSNKVMLRFGTLNRVQVFVVANGALVSNELHTLTNITDFNKFAFKYKSGDNRLFVNGSKVDDNNDTFSFTSDLNKVDFNEDGGQNFFGKNKALAVYKEALTDANLRCLTYPNPVATTFDLDFDTIAEQFTFTRGSEATFVNEQGLIESTNQIGPELITNGDFATDSDWVKGTGWSIEDGYASANASPGGQRIKQDGKLEVGKIYKLTYEVKSLSSGGFRAFVGGIALQRIYVEGTYTETITSPTINDDFFIRALGTTTGSIDSVSVKEVTTATNTPRIDYSTGEAAFLLEPQSTNLITNSGSASILNNVTLSYVESPEGLNNAMRFTETTSNSQHYGTISSASVTSGVKYSISFFVKKGTHDNVRLYTQSSRINFSIRFTFSSENLEMFGSDGEIGSENFVDYGNGWYRISANATANSTGTVDIYATTKSLGSYIGSTSDYTDYYGFQIEALPYATSYIPTDGASATRNQELCNNATPVINSEEGTLYAEISALDNSSISLGICDGSTDNRVLILLQSNNTIRGFVESSDTIVFDEIYQVSSTLDYHKVAIKYKANDFALWIDGIERFTDTSGSSPIGLNKLIFNNGGNTSNFFGNTKGLKYYPKALADVQLEDLTTI